MSIKQSVLENIRLGKLVHGGQAIAEAPNGKKLFVWGGLSGELVDVRIIKKKSSYLEGIVTEVHEQSPDRIDPKEPDSFLSTSPWQIMSFKAENVAKKAILEEAFTREGIKDIKWGDFVSNDVEFGYRNKMEMGFWGDGEGLHLAHYVRGTSGKQIVDGSSLALECINDSARKIRDELQRLEVWAGNLKTVSLRASHNREVVSALFVKEKLDMSDFKLPKGLKGIDIYYSDPKSPVSVPTKKLYSFGDINLSDMVMGINITYDVMSFFQVNLPIFESALKSIKSATINNPARAKKLSEGVAGPNIVDMYSGVGTIGLAIGADTLVESDKSNIVMAKKNVGGLQIEVVHATSENAVEYIDGKRVLIVDPPRSGLHKRVVDRILEVEPPLVIYLSCNPSTQARDVKYLTEKYKIRSAEGYNFFPRTPHVESLVVLDRR